MPRLPLINVEQAIPVSTVSATGASWRGTSIIRRVFAALEASTFQAKGPGRFTISDLGVGPRILASRGTIDVQFLMGSGASTVVLVQSSYSSTTAPLLTLGVNSSGQATGSIQDINGMTVAAWSATSLGTVERTRVVHVQVAWDAASAIDGVHHVWVVVNGSRMPPSDFTTAPIAAWTPFRALYVTTGPFCETGFDGGTIFTQASANAPVLASLGQVDIAPSNLAFPLPALQLSGTITPTLSVVGALTTPSLQLSGLLAMPVNAITAWLRLADATVTGIGYSSVPDKLNSNPATQSVDARRPVNGTSSNGLPIATFASASSSSLSWPLTAQNNQTDKWGVACWVKQPINTQEAIFSISSGAAAANLPKIQLFIEASRRLRADVYISGSNGRFARGTVNDIPVAGTWFFARLAYDSSLGGDACLKLYVNGVSSVLTFANLGSGATLGTLPTVTGNAIIGNLNNSGTPSVALNGTIGPNIYILNSDLTLAQETALMNFEMPV